jgi:hypothetical protein
MARNVPVQKPRYTTPTACNLPAHDLLLRDGRRLVYQGAFDMTAHFRRLGAVRGADGRIHTPSEAGGRGGPVMMNVWNGPDGLRVIANKHNRRLLDADGRHIGFTEPLLHISLSYPDHDPDWDTIKLVRAAFIPNNIDAMMMLPAERDYVNMMAHCFQIYQTPGAWGRE